MCGGYRLGLVLFFYFCFADPWEHAIGMGLGALFVNQLVKWDNQLKEDLDKMIDKAKAANERRYFGKSLQFNQNNCVLPSYFS